jgi:hypothetical protein
MFHQRTLDSGFFFYLTPQVILDLCLMARTPAIAAVSVSAWVNGFQ